MFEQTAVFERGVGEVTDIVEKELFRIAPRTRGVESWALRPEPTAGIVRAYVQHGMQTLPQPVKLTMTGPMFRYDRPQAGRYRQFWQYDVEAIGDAGPAVDAELIELATPLLRRCRADAASRRRSTRSATRRAGPAYLADLVAYYRGHVDRLPPLERDRLERNPLRLLDSKDPAMAELNAGAPRITDRLCEAVRDALRGPPGAPRRARHPLPRSITRWSAASTTTRGPRSSSTSRVARASSRRWAAAVATTAWSSSWAASPRRASGSGSGWTAWCSRSRSSRRRRRGRTIAPLAVVVVGADPDDTLTRLRVATDLRAAGLRGARGSGEAQARPAAGGRGQGRRALRGDPRRRARERPRPAPRPPGGQPARRRARRSRQGALSATPRATATADAAHGSRVGVPTTVIERSTPSAVGRRIALAHRWSAAVVAGDARPRRRARRRPPRPRSRAVAMSRASSRVSVRAQELPEAGKS